MILVGLTGNFGMGKSFVSRAFREMGAITLDSDLIVAEILREPGVIGTVKETFGEEVMDGDSLDKGKLADIIFRYAHLRIALEDILHPRVFQRLDEELERIGRESPQIVIVEAPILFERGYQNRFDIIITVAAPEDIALHRLRERGILEEEVGRRMASQLPIEIKKRGSDFVIDNSGEAGKTEQQVKAIYEDLMRRMTAHGNN
ncbi:MAG: dephospho-CoA kinase [Nitrospirales bacterium]|nr:dephospho-CoA kinase [Nitrospirales bacterium]